MSDDECRLFESILTCSMRYLEFGCGGSTYVAASLVKKSIISVDSSSEWLEKVRQASRIGTWSHSTSVGSRGHRAHDRVGSAIRYSSSQSVARHYRNVWTRSDSSDADLYMVDGRFRVACFMQILLHCRRNALIMIHDFELPKRISHG